VCCWTRLATRSASGCAPDRKWWTGWGIDYARDGVAGCDPTQLLVGFAADFPTIPYPYAHQPAALHGLDLGEEWLRAVLWENGAHLFGVPGPWRSGSRLLGQRGPPFWLRT
jgi:hypothetical protein